MDTILLIMFGAVLTMTTALTFMEVRRIRKSLEVAPGSTAGKSSAAGA